MGFDPPDVDAAVGGDQFASVENDHSRHVHVGGRGFQRQERGIQMRERLVVGGSRGAQFGLNLGMGIGAGSRRRHPFGHRGFRVGFGTGQVPGDRAHRHSRFEDQRRFDRKGGLVVQ